MPTPNPTNRREYKGAAAAAHLVSGIGAADTSFTIDTANNWPTGAVGNFIVTINRGQADEEKVLCSAQSGRTVTVAASGRGFDGTTAQTHSPNATVECTLSAFDADEWNQHTNAASGVHGVAGSVVGTTDAQTLTNKTISGGSNTLSGIGTGALSATGTANNTTYLRGDNTWAAPPGGMTDPTTTKGDLIVHGATTTRLPVGTDNQVLTADSTQANGVKWATPATSGSYGPAYFGAFPPVGSGSTVTANYTYYTRVRAQENLTISALRFIVSTASAGTATVGIYSDSSGAPGTRLGSGTGSTGAGTGPVTASLGGSVNVTAGTTYWLAFSSNTASAAFVQALAIANSDFARMETGAVVPATATPVALSGNSVPVVYALVP